MPFDRVRSSLLRLAAPLFLVAIFTLPAAAQGADTDGDTMPDAWELFFGLDPNSAADAAGDPDGDGLSNAQEYAAGRHPVGRFARFFAEGSTGYFDTALAVLNLSTTDTAHVSIALLDEAGGVATHRITLAPRARQSIAIDSIAGDAGAVSIIVESDVAIAADRAMTWGPSGLGLSLDSGAAAPATTWYFAEGATGSFLLYYLFENPGTVAATITVRYLREGDTPITRTRLLPPHSRTTIFVNAEDPGLAAASLGAVVTADQPILAERAMYLQANGSFAGGSASSGAPALSTQWYFGEGATGPFFHAFLSLLNPGSTPATATVTYHLSDGSTASKAYTVPAEGRRTIYFNDEAATAPELAPLAAGAVWFTVSATQPIVGERAMWWSQWPWYEGHAAVGSIASDVAWGVAEGRSGGPGYDETYVLVGNTTATPGQVRVTLIPDSGSPDSRDLPIAPGARLTINVGSLFGLTAATRFSVTVESLGATPVPLAVDYARYRSVGGVPFSGGGAAPAVPLLPVDTAPSVIATLPADGATGASSTSDLVVTFNEPVNAGPGAFSLACPSGSPIALTVATASPASQFTLDPAVPLPPSTTCVLTVQASAITDVDSTDPPDVMTTDAVVAFTTAAEHAPAIVSTVPAAGSTQIGVAANLTITFSEPVNVAANWFQIVCTTSGTRTVAGTAVSGGPTTFTIDPLADFAPGESCTVTVAAAQVTDQDPIDPPDAMAADHMFGFTIDVAPSVTATLPANGATQVATTAAIAVTFSEPVDVIGAWLQVTCTTSGSVAGTVTGGPTVYTFHPAAPFAAGETCTATVVAAQVHDQDPGDQPDTMAADVVFGFAVDTPPSVIGTSPAHNATGVSAAANITVTFSESVNATAASFTLLCGGSPQAFALSASPGASFTLNPTADLPAGVLCTVTVVAAQITDVDAGDPPDAMAADYVFSFAVPPDAVNDARGATGNVPIDTAITGFSVLGNDLGPGIAVTAFDSTTARGGSVGVNAAGLFTYTPPAGYEGLDSFSYTITNPAGSDTAVVTLAVSGMLWFVDDSAALCIAVSDGCGRLNAPFSTLASFEAANGGLTANGGDVVDPEAGDHVFIYAGTYSGPLMLEAGQRVIGQGAQGALAALTGLTFAPDSVALPPTFLSSPTITGGGVILAANNQLHGLAFTTGGTAVSGPLSVGTFTMSDIVVTNTSGAGISFTGGGSVTSFGTNTIQTTTGTALTVANTAIGAAGLTFRSISVNGASKGIVLDTTGTGGTNGGLTITGAGSAGSGGTIQNVLLRGAEFINTKAVSLSHVNFVSANTVDGGGAGTCEDLVIAGCNSAIYLSGVSGASFTNVHLSGTMVENGITGLNVANFVFANSSISGAGDEAHESGMEFQNLSGTSAIVNSDIAFSETNAVDIVNTDVNLNLSITGSSLRDSQTVSAGGATNGNGEGGLQFRSFSAPGGLQPATNIDITGSQFLRLRTQGIQAIAEDDSIVSVDITGNTIDSGADIGAGIDLNANDTALLRFNVIGNPTIRSNSGAGVNVTTFLASAGQGRVNGNGIQTDVIGSGLRFVAQETSHLTVEARNNQVTLGPTSNSPAIDTQARFDTARLDLTLGSNTTVVNATAVADINIVSGSSGVGESNVVCANLTNNAASAPGVARALRLRVSDLVSSTRLFLQGFNTSGEGTWNANGNTPVSAGDSEVVVSLTGTAVAPSGSVCAVPANPLP